MLKSNQVLVKAEYASLNPCDFKFRRAKLPLSFVSDFLFLKPKIPAVDVAGLVVSVGSDVTNLSVRDRVAATQPIIHTRWGTLAEFSAVDAAHTAIVPASISLRDAAAVSLVGLAAVQALSNVKTKKGDRILIHAGSGGLGSFAVQWASKVLKLNVSATASMIFKEIEGDNIKAVVDSEFGFNVEGVREAYRRLETGRAKGKILVKMTF